MIRKIIKISELDTADHIHDKMGEFLDLPRYYSRNFDALFDVLTDVTERMDIAIDYEGMTLREVPACTLTALRVLFDAAMVTPALRIVKPEDLPEEPEVIEPELVAPEAEAVIEPELETVIAPDLAESEPEPAVEPELAAPEPASAVEAEPVIEPELATPEAEPSTEPEPASEDAAASTTSAD